MLMTLSGTVRGMILALLLAAAMMVSACESPKRTTSSKTAAAATPAQTASIGDFNVPLPPGNWQVAYSGEKELSRGTSFRKLLVSVSEGVMDRVILLYNIRIGINDYFKPRESCSNTGYYYQATTLSEEAKEDCWHVRTVSFGLSGDPHWINKALDLYAKKLSAFAPAEMVGVRFVRHKESELLQVDYLWNPDLLMPRPDGGVWSAADWTNAAVASDPQKKLIMDWLRKWAADWHPRIARTMPF